MIKLYFVVVHIELWNYEVTFLTVLMIVHIIRIYVLIIFQIMKLGWSHSTCQNSKTNLSHFTSNKRGLIIGSLSYYSNYYNAFVSLLIILTMILTSILTMNNSWFIIHHIDIIFVWWFGTFFIFPYIGNNIPNWRTHIFQRGRYTTHQILFHITSIPRENLQENLIFDGKNHGFL